MADGDILDADDIEKIAVTLDEAGFTVKAAALREHDRALRVDRDGWRTLSGLVQDWYTSYRRRNPEGQVAVLAEVIAERESAANASARRETAWMQRAHEAEAKVAALIQDRDAEITNGRRQWDARVAAEAKVAVLTEDLAECERWRGHSQAARWTAEAIVDHHESVTLNELSLALARAEEAETAVAVLTEERDSQAVAINLLHAAAAEVSRERNAATERVAVLEVGLREAEKAIHAVITDRPTVHSEPVWLGLLKAEREIMHLLGGVPATKEEQT